MGLVDEQNRVNFYDGRVRVVDPEGKELVQVRARRLREAHRRAGRAVDLPEVPVPARRSAGRASWTARTRASTAPRRSARLNVSDGMTHAAGAGGLRGVLRDAHRRPHGPHAGPPHAGHPLGAARRDAERRRAGAGAGPQPGDHPPRELPGAARPRPRTRASGIVEAPRGTLTHHYVTDENGIVQKVNLIVGTTNNHAAICMSIKQAAQGV